MRNKTTNKDYVALLSKGVKEGVKYNLSYRTYGKAIIIPTSIQRSILVCICLITPFSNWLILFQNKLIKKDLIFRYL